MDKLKELELDLKACLQMIEGIRASPFNVIYQSQLDRYVAHVAQSYQAYLNELVPTRKE